MRDKSDGDAGEYDMNNRTGELSYCIRLPGGTGDHTEKAASERRALKKAVVHIYL